ncbi:unnamed protein product, partial [marine sediment metagenome]
GVKNWAFLRLVELLPPDYLLDRFAHACLSRKLD